MCSLREASPIFISRQFDMFVMPVQMRSLSTIRNLVGIILTAANDFLAARTATKIRSSPR